MTQKQSHAVNSKGKFVNMSKPVVHTALFSTSALSSRHTRLMAGLAFTVAGFGGISDGYALPTGATVVSGQVTVSQTAPNQLVINQTTNSAIINWQGFD